MSNFDETMLKRLTKLEREVERLRVKERPAGGSGVTDHGALTGLSDDDHPQYLLTTAKAADSDKLNGQLGSYYLSTTGKAADSDKLDGLDSTAFLQVPTFSTTAPTPTASSGTFTTVSCNVKAITIGKLRIISGLVYIGNAGTASGTLRVPYPSGAPASIGGGRWAGAGYSTANVNCIVSLLPSNDYLEILKYDGTTAIGTGASISFSISYELS